ncbi:hypothetical protein V9L05_18265 [Bernardetia sp. Wsw4-3y2]|uniref:phosphoribosyltransferase-like protein n=1 Tax=Bernardetia sp. Wsw4-3y2 TaxID=3127471 RepID=UPI0030D29BE8
MYERLEDISSLFRVKKLFNSKNWATKESSDYKKPTRFDRFCTRIATLKQKQQIDFFLELSEDIRIIDAKEFEELICYSIMNFLEKVDVSDASNIYIYPLISPFAKVGDKYYEIRSGSKSSEYLHGALKRFDCSFISDKVSLEIEDNFKVIMSKFDNTKDFLLLIDDFIGSGDTAIKTCREIISYFQDPKNAIANNKKILDKNIKIVCIAAQEQGLKFIQDEIGIVTFADIVLKKGISDKYEGENLDIKLELMKDMELALKVPNSYAMGYKKTESLIVLAHRPPNNTFPVYWWETNEKPAPFPRYSLYLKK